MPSPPMPDFHFRHFSRRHRAPPRDFIFAELLYCCRRAFAVHIALRHVFRATDVSAAYYASAIFIIADV
jgi:hypothetical protein